MPKGGKDKKGKPAILDGVNTTPMKKEKIQKFALQLREACDREQEERDHFHRERDKLSTYWGITRSLLDQAYSRLRKKERELEDVKNKNRVDSNFQKQKVKHFKSENQKTLTHYKMESMTTLKKAQYKYHFAEEQLIEDMRDLKETSNDFQFRHDEQIKDLKLLQKEEISNIVEDYNERLAETDLKYDRKITELKKELEIRHSKEMKELEESKRIEYEELIKYGDDSFDLAKCYYNDITLNNLTFINTLSTQMGELQLHNDRLTIHVNKLTADNENIKNPLNKALNEISKYKTLLENRSHDQALMSTTSTLLENVRKELSNLKWTNEALELRYELLQAQYNKEKKQLFEGILNVQQKTIFKTELLWNKTKVINDSRDVYELFLNEEFVNTEMYINSVKHNFEVFLQHKNLIINDLLYEIERLHKAYNDLLHTYEDIMDRYNVPKSELGFIPRTFPSDDQRSLFKRYTATKTIEA